MDQNGELDFPAALAAFAKVPWKEIGAEDARSLGDEDLAQCGYSNPNSNSTPWTDSEPEEAREFCQLDDEQDQVEIVIRDAKDSYNEGFIEEEEAAITRLADERSAHLARADAAGWRICVFGLPGASAHVARVAPPGEADKISDEIFNPGPVGPYDSEIVLPSSADERNWQDGTPIYMVHVAEILSQVD